MVETIYLNWSTLPFYQSPPMKELFSFRKGTLADLPQLKLLGLNAYGEYSMVLTEPHWKKFHDNLQNEADLADLIKQAIVFVCETNDRKIVGVIYFIPSGQPTEIFLKEWCTIRRLGVDPSSRGQGIAWHLTKYCIDYAKQTNEQTIALHTSEFMNDARKLYEKWDLKN